MSACVSFHVSGAPAVAGSKNALPGRGRAAGRAVLVDGGTPAARQHRRTWRSDVQAVAIDAMGDTLPYAGPVRLFAEFALPVPTSMPKRDRPWRLPARRPDVDKLFRALGDALTGIVWVDDSQVVVAAVNKVYAHDGRIGVHVEVSEIDDDSARTFAEVRARIANHWTLAEASAATVLP